MPNSTGLCLIPLSSLEKVFPDERPTAVPFKAGSLFENEAFSFQIAYHWSEFTRNGISISIESSLAAHLRISKVGLVPCELPNWSDHDEDVLRVAPGLFPDPLLPLDDEGLTLLPEQWRSLWIEVDGGTKRAGSLPPGTHPIHIRFLNGSDTGSEVLGQVSVALEVLPLQLPRQEILHTEWFHTDCLATYYGDQVFSDAHWHRIRQYVETAVAHGMNTLLTPLFTPPLDTAVGGERPTVQLVDVRLEQEHAPAADPYREPEQKLPVSADPYRKPEQMMSVTADTRYVFGFERLEQWMALAEACGITHFEMSHLFTQWGAEHAPKIMATLQDGKQQRIFGWETDASGEAYVSFLNQFLPALLGFLRQTGREGKVLFHVSDEPSMQHLSSYRSASDILRRHTGDIPVIDALSDFAFYEQGLVANPIPANNHITPFLEAGIPHLWTYYCCAQNRGVANRFFSMPSARSRILGIQLYLYDIAGFLQWGYNFWYTQNSRRRVDPFKETDAGYAFPGGDAFVVYPGPDGPIESLRLKVIREAFQDLRALKLLESRIGKSQGDGHP